MSALTPTIELGGQWPPMGIEPVNPFELPLLNTVILLSSGATITYGHHSLIQGKRSGALYGSIATVLLAVIFTGFQGVEYAVSSFTISDGAYGTCFYFGTGFHGLIITNVALYIYIYNYFKTKQNILKNSNHNSAIQDKFFISLPNSANDTSNYYLEAKFLEWFVGFTDGEGNFHIKTTDLKESTFKSVQFTFQIGLHKDDIQVLEYIMNTLKCGHISKSGNRVNYFINDKNSLLNIVLPIFNNTNLNSSKYYQFKLFEKAVLLINDKQHLLPQGKMDIIKYKKEMQDISDKSIPASRSNSINITKYWLAGFIDAEGSFSTNKYVPRFKIENHIREFELYQKMREFIGIGNITLAPSRVDKLNSNPTIVLEINKINDLIKVFIPLIYNKGNILLKTLKVEDFNLWLKLVDLYYKGYHTTIEGKYIFDAIKLHINKYRMTSNTDLFNERVSIVDINNLLDKLYLSESPYEIKQGIRYYRNTDKLISESTKIVVIDTNNTKTIYDSMSQCALSLHISRKKIKECLSTGESYKGFCFVYN